MTRRAGLILVFAASVRLQKACAADAVSLRGEVLDAETGKPIACRLYIQSKDGAYYFAKSESPSGSAVEYKKQKPENPASTEMHTTLSAHPFAARVPAGSYTLIVERGKEYFPESRQVEVDKDGAKVTVRLKRWINTDANKPLRPRRVEVDYLIQRIEDEIARGRDVLPAAALDEYREALGIYKEIAKNAR